jgi:methylthioribose-1-phosphate isomerase
LAKTRIVPAKPESGIPAVLLVRQDTLFVLDQRKLPRSVTYVTCTTASEVAAAITSMAVRGAPAIGLCAALGLAVVAKRSAHMSPDAFVRKMERAAGRIAAARPTAADLGAVVRRILDALHEAPPKTRVDAVVATAEAVKTELEAACARISQEGARLLEGRRRLMTYCNTGSLATGVGHGTALGAIIEAARSGKVEKVWVPETRPYLQGSRLTAFELWCAGIRPTVIPDSAAPSVIAAGEVDAIVVGADRIAANGDVANKIGTYGLAVAASLAGIPFYVAAPLSTFDIGCRDAAQIPIEARSGAELVQEVWGKAWGRRISAYYPAFDVTPGEFVTAIVCEEGVLEPPYPGAIRSVLAARQ